jgi:hypothetical protein
LDRVHLAQSDAHVPTDGAERKRDDSKVVSDDRYTTVPDVESPWPRLMSIASNVTGTENLVVALTHTSPTATPCNTR